MTLDAYTRSVPTDRAKQGENISNRPVSDRHCRIRRMVWRTAASPARESPWGTSNSRCTGRFMSCAALPVAEPGAARERLARIRLRIVVGTFGISPKSPGHADFVLEVFRHEGNAQAARHCASKSVSPADRRTFGSRVMSMVPVPFRRRPWAWILIWSSWVWIGLSLAPP